jgi:hypothetical protein
MKKIRAVGKKIAFVLAVLLFVCSVNVAPSEAEADIASPADWPTWPEPTKPINDLSITEPATFLSIGREVVPWPFFGETSVDSENYINLVGADLYFTIEKFTYEYDSDLGKDVKVITGYETVDPNKTATDPLYMVLGNKTVGVDALSDADLLEGYWDGSFTLPGLYDTSVYPVYDADWLTYGEEPDVTEVPNESFLADQQVDPNTYLDAWKVFLVEDRNVGDTGFFFADSGHAPPHMVWPFDPWLYSYRSQTGYYSGPEAWEDRYVCLWPTNQGALQAFEASNVDIADSTPYVDRTWLTIPNPSFRQSIYNELRKVFHNEQYKRLTVLDGPVTVRDIEINGEWRRIVVGTTGMGTGQLPKPQNAWTELDQSEYDPLTTAPEISNRGRAFGVYAFDITDLGVDPSTSELESLWSVANVFYSTTERSYSDYFPENNTGTAKSEYADYADMRFSVSKPLIGYTKDGDGDRTWHVIILGVDKEDRYYWLDVEPEDGSVRRSGYFVNGYTNNAETLQSVDFVEYGYFTGEEVETVFPSRILSAFPPPESQYREPLLSDVYVHLSNGAIYRWDLNPADSEPEWLLTVKCERADEIAPPLTDFDVTHLGGETYLATNALLRNVPGAAKLDTEGLLVLNLTKVAEYSVEERAQIITTIKVPPGQSGEVVSSEDDHILFVQLELPHGTSTTDSKTVLASPVFISREEDGLIESRLFLAFYELSSKGEQGNGQESEVSRLYSFLFEAMMGQGNVQNLDEAEIVDGEIVGDYFDFEDREVAMMVIDSQGNLVLFDASGNIVGDPIPTGLSLYADDGNGEDPFEGEGVHLVYWKTK